MLHFKQFRESYYRVQWRADFVTHVMQEGVLHNFHLLSADGFLCQLCLNGLDLTDVTTHAEILYNFPILIGGNEVHLQIHGNAFPAYIGLDVCVYSPFL